MDEHSSREHNKHGSPSESRRGGGGGAVVVVATSNHSNKTSSKTSSVWGGNLTVVIAKYDEDLSWIADDLADVPVEDIFIYSKNKKPFRPDIYPNNIIVANIGREAHTYLTYIVQYYDKLKERTIFSQAGYKQHYPQRKLTDWTIRTNFFLNWTYWTYDEIGRFRLPNYSKKPLTANKENLTFAEWMIKYIEPNFERLVKEPTGAVKPTDKGVLYANFKAIFCVRKANIRSRPLAYYQRLLDTQFEAQNTETAHFFERAWYYVFQCFNKTLTVY